MTSEGLVIYCHCRKNPMWVHADHIQPGEAVWLPDGRWIRYDWSDRPENTESEIEFCPDGGTPVTVPALTLLRRVAEQWC